MNNKVDEKLNLSLIAGASSGGSSPRTPVEDPDSLQSNANVSIIDLIGEGQIGGLVANSSKENSILLNGTPMRHKNGEKNFENVAWLERTGQQIQDYIEGFGEGVETPFSKGVQLKAGEPSSFKISSPNTDRVRILIAVNALTNTNTKNGDISGTSVSISFRISLNGRGYKEIATKKITGKTTSRYQRSFVFDLPKAMEDGTPVTSWDFQVVRLTPDSQKSEIQNTTYFDSYSEVALTKFTYPNSALIATRFNAEAFSSIPKREYLVDGLLIKVPSNYDHQQRTYSGVWDGTFKLAASDNPAWILYDLLLNERYGLGRHISVEMIDEARLYQIGQYCDQLVDDGFGKKEPRYTINCVLNNRVAAYDLIVDICSAFNGMAYWAGDMVGFTIDAPSDPVLLVNNTNIVGDFSYSGTSVKDRHSIAVVTWNDPEDDYKQVPEPVEDHDLIARYGIRKTEIMAFGCTSRGQAARMGRWMLYSEHQQSEMIAFKLGLDSSYLLPGDLIQIQDRDRAGKRLGGRLLSCTATSAILDDQIEFEALENLEIDLRLEDGSIVSRPITSHYSTTSPGSNNTKTVTVVTWAQPLKELPVKLGVWIISSQNLEPVLARVVNIAQGDQKGTFDITAIPHNPSKYLSIENDLMLEVPKTTILDSRNQVAPKNVYVKSEIITSQGIAKTRAIISWDEAKNASQYEIEWKRNDSNWVKLPRTSSLSIEIEDAFAGIYTARVTAFNIFGAKSYPKYSNSVDVQGKTGKPQNVVGFTVTPLLFGMKLDWVYPNNSADTSHAIIEVSDYANGSKPRLVGSFAYPANTHSIQGLHGNLDQYYRIKTVDKTGNESDWSDFIKGTTSADPEEILKIIEGEIGSGVFDPETKERLEKIEENSKAILKETNERAAADIAESKARNAAITKEANDRASAIAAEATNRANAITNAISKEVSERNAAIAIEANNRLNAINKEISERNVAIDSKAAEINNSINVVSNSIAQEINERKIAIKAEMDARNGAIAKLNDGLTTEIQQRKTEDASLLKNIETYKTSTNNTLASVQQQITTNATNISSQTSKMMALDGRVTAAENGLAKKLDASVIDKYSTTVETDKAIADRVSEYNASLTIGGKNFWWLSNAGSTDYGTRNVEFITEDRQHQRITITGVTSNFFSNLWQGLRVPNGGPIPKNEPTSVSFSILSPYADIIVYAYVWGQANNVISVPYKVTPNEWTRVTLENIKSRYVSDINPGENYGGLLGIRYHGPTIGIPSENLVGTVFEIKDVQCQIGSKATAYEKPQAITDNAINANANAIQITQSKVDNIDGRVTSNSSSITGLKNDMSVIKNDVSKKADSSAVSAIQSTIDQHDKTLTSQGSALNELKNSINTLQRDNLLVENKDQVVTGAVYQQAIVATKETLNLKQGDSITVRGKLSFEHPNVLAANQGLALYLDASQRLGTPLLFKQGNDQTFEVTTKMTNDKTFSSFRLYFLQNGTAVASTKTTLHWVELYRGESLIGTKADASAVTALDNKVTEIDGKVSTNSSAITRVEGRVNEVDAKAGTALQNSASAQTTANSAVDKANANASNIIKVQGSIADKPNNIVKTSFFEDGERRSWQGTQIRVIDITTHPTYKKGITGRSGTYNWESENIQPAQAGDVYDLKAFCDFTGTTVTSGRVGIVGLRFWNKDMTSLGFNGISFLFSDGTGYKTATVTAPVNTAFIQPFFYHDGTNSTTAFTDLTITKRTAIEEANAAGISAITTRVTNAEGKIESQSSSITKLENDLNVTNANVSKKAEASALTTLDSKVTSIDGKLSSQGSQITQIENGVTASTRLAQLQSQGKPTVLDPTFLTTNGLSIYRSVAGASLLRRDATPGNPSGSTKEYFLTSPSITASGIGYYPLNPLQVSSANKIYLVKHVAKAPVGYTMNVAKNGTGDGAIYEILGSNAGTGKYETYYFWLQCGENGTFSTFGHVFWTKDATSPAPTPENPLEITITSYEVWDVTSVNDSIPKAWADRVSTTSTALQSLDSKVTSIDGKVTQSANAITSLTGRVTTVEQGLSRKADASVLTNYSTKTETNAAVATGIQQYDASLNIGGTNMAYGTNSDAFIPYVSTGADSFVRYFDAYPTRLARVDFKTQPIMGFITPRELRQTQLITGKTYTLSFLGQGTMPALNYNYIIVEGGANFRLPNIPLGAGNNNLRSLTFTWTEPTISTAGILLAASGKTEDWFNVRGLMLEESTKPSSWSPNPNEIQTSLDANATAITTTQTQVTNIDGRVKSNSNTLTTLTNRLSAAECALMTKADAKAVQGLDQRVTKAEGQIEAQSSAITTLTTSLKAGATTTAINSTVIESIVLNLGNAEISKVPDANGFGGHVIKIGDNNGNDTAWIHGSTFIPVDEKRLYRVKARYRRVTGNGVVYIGLACLNADKKSFVNTLGGTTSNLSSSNYLTNHRPPLGEWQDATWFVTGRGNPGASGSGTMESPRTFQANAAWFAPMAIANYDKTAGEVEIDYISIEYADEYPLLDANSKATQALDSKVQTIDGKVSSNTSAITQLSNRVTSTEGQIATKAEAKALQSLDQRVTKTEGDISTQSRAITQLDNTLNMVDGTNLLVPNRNTEGKGAVYRLVNIPVREAITLKAGERVTVRGMLSFSHNGTLTSSQGIRIYLDGSPAFSNLYKQGDNQSFEETLVVPTDRSIQNLSFFFLPNGTANTSSQLTVHWAELARGDIKADATALNALDTKVTKIDGQITTTVTNVSNLTTRMMTAEGKITANSNALSSLDSTVKDINGTVTAQGSNITRLGSRVDANAGPGIAQDFLCVDAYSWYDHYNLADSANLLPYFNIPIADGPMGDKGYYAGKSSSARFVYNKTPLPTAKRYRVQFWAKRTADATGACFVTIMRTKAGEQPNVGNYTYVSITNNELPANNTWAYVDKVIDATSYAATFPRIYLGFSINNTNVNGECWVQGFKVTELIETADAPNLASAEAVNSLTTRVTNTEGKLNTQANQITSLNTTVAGKADNSAVTNLTSRVTTAEGNITALNGKATALESRVTTAEGKINANSKALSTLDTKVTDIDGKVTNQASALTSLSSRFDGQIVGGTNLHPGTQKTSSYSLYTSGSYTKISGNFKTEVGRIIKSATGPQGIVTAPAYRKVVLKSGNQYIITAKVRGNANINYVYLMNATATGTNTAASSYTFSSPMNEDTFVTLTAMVTSASIVDKTDAYLLLAANGSAAGTWFEFAEVMIQEGNTATVWGPSYLDVPEIDESKFASASAQSALETKVSNIDGRATSQASLITNLQSQMGNKADASILTNYYTKTQADSAIAAASTTLESKVNKTTDEKIEQAQGKTSVLDLTKLDNETYYPVTIWLPPAGNKRHRFTLIRYLTEFEGVNPVYWATHASKTFSVELTWEVAADGWGANNTDRKILSSQYAWTGWSPVLGPEQMVRSSEEVIYLRGGALYRFICDPRLTPTVRTGPYTVEGITVQPIQYNADMVPNSDVGKLHVKINEQSEVIDGIKAVKSVTVDNNGMVSGWGLVSELKDGKVNSTIGFKADQIYFESPNDGRKPFVVLTEPREINGTLYPAGTWIDAAYIAQSTIKLAHIDTASIGSLSAISANLGTMTTLKDPAKPFGARMVMTGSLITVFDDNNVVRVKLGLW